MFEQQRIAMVDGQLRTNKITHPAVVDLFLTTPREVFAPKGLEGSAYVDEDMDLGHGRALLEPLVAARLLQEADMAPGMTTLVVGAANGYMAKLLVDLAANVTALESQQILADQGQELVPEASWVVQDLRNLPAGPFDRIIVSGSLDHIPQEWAGHLAPQGRILAPIAGETGNDGRLVEAQALEGVLSSRTICNAAVPQLPEFAAKPQFEF